MGHERDGTLAAVLITSCDEIIERCAATVLADPDIRSARHLSHDALRDYFPKFLRAIASELAGESPPVTQEALARVHAHHRIDVGYSLAEAVKELRTLRACIEPVAPVSSKASGLKVLASAFAQAEDVLGQAYASAERAARPTKSAATSAGRGSRDSFAGEVGTQGNGRLPKR